MKKIHTKLFVCAFIASLFIGCASKSGWQGENTPVPRSTPFDSNQMQRAAYLEGFRSGYRAQTSGSTLGVVLENGPYLHERQLGFQAGVAHARAQQSPDSAPATQIHQAR